MEIPLDFQKMGIKTPFEFILHYVPKSYDNNILSHSLQPNTQATLEVEVLRFFTHKYTKVLCYAPFFDIEIELIIFHPKPFHKVAFSVGKHLIVNGKIQKNGICYQLIQPKILKQTGEIFPNFGYKGVKEAAIKDFSKICVSSLNTHYPNVSQKYLQALNTIYQPNAYFFNKFQAYKGFFNEYLESLKFVEIYEYMRKLKLKKREFESLKTLNGDIQSWIDTLPFLLTSGQKKAILEIQQSLKNKKSTRRVIVGDVGCGKTMVIFAAVMIAYPNKSLLMAPTSLLAKQIYNEAQKLLPPHVRISLFTQTTKAGNLQDNEFLIGTHALLYQELEDYPLIMIDEQHRFGTAQRNFLERKLEKNLKRPHILQFSATPIPRTLAMIESNFLDFSFIEDSPFEKNIISTTIGKQDFRMLLNHIQQEIHKGHQIIIIYPLVEQGKNSDYTSLKEGESFWKKHFDKVYVTHGKDKNKESVLEDFRENGNILLATTVVEVGISLPKLSTIVIVGAEHLGLATLHQLRGRVSRNGLRGYCFLYTNKGKNDRLEKFCQIQKGFEIAKMDLQYRNSGDLLSGEQQSGKNFSWINLSLDESIIQNAQKALQKIDSTS